MPGILPITETGWLIERPIAHRGLHDLAAGRPENSLAAAKAAIAAGYAIEVDLHPSSDLVPMVFHDDRLDRLTGEKGAFRAESAANLGALRLLGTGEAIPRLSELLDVVAGRTGLVLELKGIADADTGFVEAVLDTLSRYKGPVAIMSFNHWLLADARRLQAEIPVGLTGEGGDALADLHRRAAADFSVDFVSYAVADLPNAFVAAFRAEGGRVISWTVRNETERTAALADSDQITFEGFMPPVAAPVVLPD